MKRTALLLPVLLLCGLSGPVLTRALDTRTGMATPSAQSAGNKGGMTRASQSDSDKDAALAERIRRAIVKDNNFSTTAKNVKVLFKDGIVTLRGSVRNDQEKAEIITRTRRIAGTAKIDDELDILGN